MTLVSQAALGILGTGALFSAAWLVSLYLDDVSIVDLLWGPAFALLTWGYLAMDGGAGLRPWLVAALVTLWAVRLAWHLTARHQGEDPRYTAMRERNGPAFRWRSLVTVFWLQAALVWVLSWPLLMAVRVGGSPGLLDALGTGLFVAGFVFEAVADLQLTRFRRRPDSAGRVLDGGLWRYSRHPNYFGEALLWWGLWMLAVPAGGWWTVFSPILMTWLLLRVSGVPLLEGRLKQNRPEYESYAGRTSAFVPWPPRSPARTP